MEKLRDENTQKQENETESFPSPEEQGSRSSAPPAFLPDTNSILQVLAKFTKNETDGTSETNRDDTEGPADNAETNEPVIKTDTAESQPELPSAGPSSSISTDATSGNNNVGSANNLLMQLFQQGNTSLPSTTQSSALDSLPAVPSTTFNNSTAESSITSDPRSNLRRSRSPDDDSSGPNKRMKADDSFDEQGSGFGGNNQDSDETEHFDRPRNVIRDPTIREGSIKVLSRTLFIGGVPHNISEQELSDQLNQFGKVQSVVIHKEGKHAFVKLYSRQEAEITRERCEEERSAGRLSLRARWGVGFGPRECCEYETGISIIPLSKLTEADKRWTVQAEYGGTGGLPLESGMCVEEPDIEIGAGVSSKAISQRMPSNSSRNGPKSSRIERGERDRQGRGPAQDHGRPFGKNRFGGNGGGPVRSGNGNNGHGEDRRGRFDRSKRNGRGNRNDSGPGRFGNSPHRDPRGFNDRNNYGRGNDRNNDMMGGSQGSMMGYGNMPGGNMGYGMPQMNNMGGMNNMNSYGGMAGGNNLPTNLASLLSTLTQQNPGMQGGMPGLNDNNMQHNGGHGGKRPRGHNNYNNNYGGNNRNNANDTLAQLSQLTQQLAATQQFNGGGIPMNNMMGGGNNNSYNSGMPNDPRQRGNGTGNNYGHHNNNHHGGNNRFRNHGPQGSGNMPNIPNIPGVPGGSHQGAPPGLGNNSNNIVGGGNSGLPFNVTPELAAMLLQQHQQQQQQQRR